jgi:FtsP/CotA-like multicopper oxidase with cupredoxin domain
MTVVAADGQNVQPVETDEFQIGIAETYDVIVEPRADEAYGFIAEAIDRSGQVRATLAPRLGMVAPIPPIRERPLLTMKDMGMGDMAASGRHKRNGPRSHGPRHARDGSWFDEDARSLGRAAGQDGAGRRNALADAHGPHGRTPDRSGEGPHRVLTYRDLKSLAPNPDKRTPSREIDRAPDRQHGTLHVVLRRREVQRKYRANPFRHMERVRINLINDTMMPHPIHLHGHFFELVTGSPGHHPLKHTVNVLPGGKVSFDLTADELGDWAFHCHMLLHMMSGMFRVVTVRHEEDAA